MEARHTVASTLLLLDSLVYPGSASCSAPAASPLSRPPVQTSSHSSGHETVAASVTIVDLTAVDLQAPKAPAKVRAYRAQTFTLTSRHFAAPGAKPVPYMIANFQ